MRRLGLKVVVFGGWARDRVFELKRGRSYASKDLDLVSDGPVSVSHALPSVASMNSFGGFGVQGSLIHVDAWDLRETFLIKRHRLRVSFEQLPYTADFNVNAVVFKPTQFFGQEELLDAGALCSIEKGVLDFAASEVAQPLFQAARSVILAARLQLALSGTVHAFLRTVCGDEHARRQVQKGIRDYCPTDHIDTAMSHFASVLDNRS